MGEFVVEILIAVIVVIGGLIQFAAKRAAQKREEAERARGILGEDAGFDEPAPAPVPARVTVLTPQAARPVLTARMPAAPAQLKAKAAVLGQPAVPAADGVAERDGESEAAPRFARRVLLSDPAAALELHEILSPPKALR